MEDNLEQMRAQMSLLKDRLSRCEIITDKMSATLSRGISRYSTAPADRILL